MPIRHRAQLQTAFGAPTNLAVDPGIGVGDAELQQGGRLDKLRHRRLPSDLTAQKPRPGGIRHCDPVVLEHQHPEALPLPLPVRPWVQARHWLGSASACLAEWWTSMPSRPEAADAVAGRVVDPDGVGAGQDLGIAHARPLRLGAAEEALVEACRRSASTAS
jgi:hypothetical protein